MIGQLGVCCLWQLYNVVVSLQRDVKIVKHSGVGKLSPLYGRGVRKTLIREMVKVLVSIGRFSRLPEADLDLGKGRVWSGWSVVFLVD